MTEICSYCNKPFVKTRYQQKYHKQCSVEISAERSRIKARKHAKKLSENNRAWNNLTNQQQGELLHDYKEYLMEQLEKGGKI